MEEKNKNKRRKQIRLKEYNYSEPGDYFITICTHDMECIFGEIKYGEMVLNELGKIVEECLLDIPKHFSNTEIEIFQIMPNHVHFILTILCDCRGAVSAPCNENVLNQGGETPPLQERKITLGQIIAYFKYQSTKKINQFKNNQGNKIWQRSFYDHIIDTEKSHEEIYNYIESNPSSWDRDRNNPKNRKIDSL